MSDDAKVALVTGAGRGIGHAVATALAHDGWDIAALGRSASSLAGTIDAVEDIGVRGIAIPADVRRPVDVIAAVDRIEDTFGPIHALVNNAGVQRLASALTVSEADWDDVLDTNLKGSFFCAQAVGRYMTERGSGSIVNVASAAGVIAVADRAAYGASKAGLAMVTKVLALEWAARGVRVNAIAPTFVDTELGRQTLDQPGMHDQVVGRIPMGRLATLDDLTAAVRFFLDVDASSFVTGQLLAIDGGLTLG
jgi:NAD(P)-dependent dehydrogenase (short-subunit alcohol dehydrogenase family)